MNKKGTRRLRWLKMKKNMSLRAIGAAESPPVSGEYVRQIIGNTGHVRPVKAQIVRVHAFIKAYAKSHSFPPSLQDIANTFPNLDGDAPTSLSVVKKWLEKLEGMGKLKITRGIRRGIRAL